MLLLGGIGLFLLGMTLLTEGIKAFAGDALRQALTRFAGRPFRAFLSGMLVTVVVQSSSATTVTVIGFVSAGLLTFAQAVCVVIGASLGTTGSSWLVSVLGLRFSLGFYALPLVTFGTVLRLVNRTAMRHAGLAIAGFGLILLGIQTLQEGMEGFSAQFNIAGRSASNLWDHLLLMLSGAGLTLITQSSSAATATVLTALHARSINFEQAASLVIGAAAGTTVTSVLAAIGASIPARRTALAHVVFNVATSLIAIVLLPLFLRAIHAAQDHLGLPPGAISLAVFHTCFIGLGVVLFMPFVRPFARWIERLLPETGPRLTRHLDASVLHIPEVALEASRRALCETATRVFTEARKCLIEPGREFGPDELPRVQEALEEIQRFVRRIPPLPESRPMSVSRVAQMHALDHLLRLEAALQPPRTVTESLVDSRLAGVMRQTADILQLAVAGLRGRAADDWVQRVGEQSEELADLRRRQRVTVLEQTAGGEWDPNLALNLLDTVRWLDRLGYHTWRICHYLHGSGAPLPPSEETGGATA